MMDGLDAQGFIEIKIATIRTKPGFHHSEEYLEKKNNFKKKAASVYRLVSVEGRHAPEAFVFQQRS